MISSPQLFRLAVALATASAMLGCPKDPAGPPEWADLRIDHGDEFDPEPESSPPALCVSGKYAYVAWHDDRAMGTNNVYLQVSQDGGSSWNPTDMRVNSNPDGEWLAENPGLACDEQAVYVVWEDDRDGVLKNKAIYFNASYDAGGSWFGEDLNLTVDDAGDWNSLAPQITLGGADLYVSWYDGRDGAYDIYFNYSADWGSTWMGEGARVDTDDRGAAYSAKPRMAVDGVGGVHVIWEDLRNGNNDIFYNKSADFGAHWADPDTRVDQDEERTDEGLVASAPAESFGAAVAAESEGLVAVAWHDLRNGELSDIYVAISQSGGTSFMEPLRLDALSGPGVSDSLYPDVVVVNGEVLVAFRDDRQNDGFDVFFTRSEDAGLTFSDEVAVDTDGGTAHSVEPQMLAETNGTVAIAWTDLGNPANGDWEDILLNVSTDGGASWLEEELRVDDDESHTARSAGMQMELQEGELFFAWVDYRMGLGDIFFRSMEP